MANYSNYISAMGGADKYAQEIKRKEQQGLTFDDPGAAASFRRDNPQYFNDTWTRDYLEGKGIYNVGWNPQTKAVQVGGMDVFKPAYNIDGKSYASQQTIDQALQGAGIMSPVDQENNILKQLFPQVNQQFTYDPQTDPVYQAAVEQAQRGAQTASKGALELMNERGILNSTVAGDRVAQIQQDALANVNANILPQLMNQAYSRQQDQIGNLMSLYDIVSGMEQQGYDRKTQEQLFALQEQDRQIEQQQRDIENALATTQQYGFVPNNKIAQILGVNVSTPTFEAREAAEQRKMQLEDMRADNARQWASINLSRERFEWDKQQSGVANMEDEKLGLVELARSGKYTPQQLLQQIKEDVQLGIYTPAQAAELESVVSVMSRNALNALNPPTIKTLEQQYYTDPTGKAAGAAKFDWIKWNQDSKGRPSGLSFNEWKKVYGPILGSEG